MRPRVGIELDDTSHTRTNRQTRDAVVQQVFDAAGLPLVRFIVQRAYNTGQIASRLSPLIEGAAIPPAPGVVEKSSSAPLCPKCGVPLVIRKSKRGTFYGCPNYPKCREIVSIA